MQLIWGYYFFAQLAHFVPAHESIKMHFRRYEGDKRELQHENGRPPGAR